MFYLIIKPVHKLEVFCVPRMALWGHNRYVVAPLGILILGHWSLILHGIFYILNDDRKYSDNYVGVLIKVAWEEGKGCVIMKTDNIILAATFIYSMVLDLIVLLLSGIQLLRYGGNLQFGSLLFKDGLIYFVIA